MRIVKSFPQPETVAMHPEAVREAATVLRVHMDEIFKREFGFYPSQMQACEALAYALGDSILLADDLGKLSNTRTTVIKMMDQATAAQVRGVALGERRDG